MSYPDKSRFGRASQPGSYNQTVPVNGIVTQFVPESFGIHRFSGSCVREYDLI